MKSAKLLLIFLLFIFSGAWAQEINIIPKPVKLIVKQGSFTIDLNTTFRFDASRKELKEAAAFFAGFVKDVSGLHITSNGKQGKKIEMRLVTKSELGDEGYDLTVTDQLIKIEANHKAGIVYGLQSLIQTLPPVRTNASLMVPAMEITDYPRFKWRGMHLDVSRHFFSPEMVKEYIDLLSAYKFNTFHWHLSDDQGWRIEIKKYPKLTEVGAWHAVRKGIPWSKSEPTAPGEPLTYGGYYTQDQVRDIVKYALERNINIVPEIDVPGHSGAAIAAYPFLGCTGNPQAVITGGVYPKNIETSLCVAKDSVYTFYKDVLSEIMALFPSKYIHIGGDEVDKTPWKNDSLSQRFMRKMNLKNEDELQSYFIREMEKFIVSKGRKMIGWDEILEGGLAPEATVMSWRGESGGIQAAKMKHDVVMTPGTPLYFDHYQAGPQGEPEAIGGMNTLKMVYDYNPVPKELTAEEGKYVLGAQANIWAEFIYSRSHLEYMMLPRMLALSEAVWTPLESKDYPDFYKRVQAHFDVFDHKGIQYCEGNYNVNVIPKNIHGKLSVNLVSEIPSSVIYYSTDGSWPNAESKVFQVPIRVDSSMVIKAVVSVNGVVKSKVPSEQEFVTDKLTGKQVTYTFPVSSYYQADGPNSLTDGIRGKEAVGKYWHGFAGKDLVATIDMGNKTMISEVSAGFLQKHNDWIFLPQYLTVETSDDGVNFTTAGKAGNSISPDVKETIIKDVIVKFTPRECRYVRVTAKNLGVCPPGHPGEGQAAWLFCDEIMAR